VGANAAVVFVNYTPSPEAKYPTVIEQAYVATKHIAENGASFKIDPKRLAVVGDSVGGNMVAAVTLLAKERSGLAIHYQVLFYPVTDANFETVSYNQFADGSWLTKPAMQWFWDAYAPNENDRKKITASPLQESSAPRADEHAIWDTLRSRKPGSLQAMPSQFETSCAI
jgi:acetyl esterase/lipase